MSGRCNTDKECENKARSDGRKGENQCEQGQRQTKHDWDNTGDGDDKNRVQMTNNERDNANDSQALTVVTSRSTEHLWRASDTCHKIDQISSWRQCKYDVRWQTRQRLTWERSRGLEGWSSYASCWHVLLHKTAHPTAGSC